MVQVPLDGTSLEGDLQRPDEARGVVLFAHGSGSGRHSPRNREVAARLRDASLATLLIDLLTDDEEALDRTTRELRFDIGLLAERLVCITDWLVDTPSTRDLAIGYFGASTGAAAALLATTRRPAHVRAIVSRGGRPDLAGEALPSVESATLLIVGGADESVIGLNEEASHRLRATHRLEIIPGATHLFEEPGALEQVADLASEWFSRYLVPAGTPRAGPQ